MGLFDSAAALLPGCMPACWRGQNFWIPDVTTEMGRRILVTYFPGLDEPAIEDFGMALGPIRVRGLIIGDDYVLQAQMLQAALTAPGPGTFLHPWMGEMTVIVPPGGASITFSAVELRVLRFEVTFQPVNAIGPFGGIAALPFGASLAAVVSRVSSLLWTARAFGAAVLGGGGAIGAATWSAACDTAVSCGGLLEEICTGAPAAPVLGPALAPGLVALDAAVALGAGDVAADAIASALVDLAAPVAEAAIGAPPSAIGPGPAVAAEADSQPSGWSVSGVPLPAPRPDTRAPAALDPHTAAQSATFGARAGAGLLLDALGQAAQLAAQGAPAEGARLVTRVGIAGHAVRTACEISYESRQDAAVWRAALDDGLSGLSDQVSVLAGDRSVLAAPASTLWRSLGDLRAALSSDMSEVIGRLPSVRTYQPAGAVNAWLLAQHFAGDDPRQVVGMFDDIVRRNRLRHPAVITGPVEVLPR